MNNITLKKWLQKQQTFDELNAFSHNNPVQHKYEVQWVFCVRVTVTLQNVLDEA